MLLRNVIKLCIERDELNFLFEITKVIAETDSIGEGFGYCEEYTREDFDKTLQAIERNEDPAMISYAEYFTKGAAPIYILYLKHVIYATTQINSPAAKRIH